MFSTLTRPKRILIVGDAARGKTTLARRLSEVLEIPCHSTDDYYWKTKFTEKQDPQISKAAIEKCYRQDTWIVEGATIDLIESGLTKAGVILQLEFANIFSQWWNVLRRHLGRKEERPRDLFNLLRHVFYKRYRIGYMRDKQTIHEIIKPYQSKTRVLRSFAEIDDYLKTLCTSSETT